MLWAEPLTSVALSTSGLVHQGHMEGALTGVLLVPPPLRDGPHALLTCVCVSDLVQQSVTCHVSVIFAE